MKIIIDVEDDEVFYKLIAKEILKDSIRGEIINKAVSEIKEVANLPEVKEKIDKSIEAITKSINAKINSDSVNYIDKELLKLMQGSFKIIKDNEREE
jgi:hypothetical protein